MPELPAIGACDRDGDCPGLHGGCATVDFALLKDSVLKDSVLKDSVLKEGVLKDSVLKEGVLKDSVLKDLGWPVPLSAT